MAVAYDAHTGTSQWSQTPNPFTFTHTPAGTPRAVVLLVSSNGQGDTINGPVTYGGVTMTRVADANDTVGETQWAFAYFLGSGVPTGTRTVSIGHTATTANKWACCITLTAGGDCEVGAFAIDEEDQANPQASLTTSNPSLRFGIITSGLPNVTDLTILSGMTALDSADAGDRVRRADRQTSPNTTGTVGWTAAIDDVAAVYVAVQEISGTTSGTGSVPATNAVTATGRSNRNGVGTVDFPLQYAAPLKKAGQGTGFIAHVTEPDQGWATPSHEGFGVGTVTGTADVTATGVPSAQAGSAGQISQTHSVVAVGAMGALGAGSIPVPLTSGGLVDGYLSLDGDGEASTTDKASLSITGDCDIRLLAAATSWTPSTPQVLYSHRTSSAGRSIYIGLGATITYSWRQSNGQPRAATFNTPSGWTAGSAQWMRFTHDIDDGNGGSDTRFYTSTDGTTWTLSQTAHRNQKTTVGDPAASVLVGGTQESAQVDLNGKVYLAEVRNGIAGTIVASPDWRSSRQGNWTSSAVDDQGNTWTLSGVSWQPPVLLDHMQAVGFRSTATSRFGAADVIQTNAVTATGSTGATSATPTPSVVANVVALPAAATVYGSTVTPSVAAAVAAVPQPGANVKAGPSVAMAAAAGPTPGVNVGAGPSVVAAPVTVSVPSVQAGVEANNPQPGSADLVVHLPAATVVAGWTTDPAVAPTTVTVPQATPAGSAVAVPAVVAVVAAVPAPQLGDTYGVQPEPGDIRITVPRPLVDARRVGMTEGFAD